MAKLLSAGDVYCMRTSTTWLHASDRGVEHRTATGRATCRACGQKIAKGEHEIVALYSFPDRMFGGSPTSTEVHVHLRVCGGSRVGVSA